MVAAVVEVAEVEVVELQSNDNYWYDHWDYSN